MKKELKELDFAHGELLLIDKPYGWTSFAVVAQLKKWMNAKIGHAGTLDPLASGLVICCTGPLTKKLTSLIGLDKEYTGIIRLGMTSATYDLESLPEHPMPVDHITTDEIQNVVARFIGATEQIPPIHSALKVEGTPMYELARKGMEVTLKPRNIFLYKFEITHIALPELHFRVVCSSGTYIRSLAHDVGLALGCGAILQSLRRTAIGEHRIENAYQIPDMQTYFGSAMNARIISPKVLY